MIPPRSRARMKCSSASESCPFEHALVSVEVAAVEGERFPDPDAARCEKADQGLEVAARNRGRKVPAAEMMALISASE